MHVKQIFILAAMSFAVTSAAKADQSYGVSDACAALIARGGVCAESVQGSAPGATGSPGEVGQSPAGTGNSGPLYPRRFVRHMNPTAPGTR